MPVRDPPFTMGIEEEYLLVDRTTRDLAPDPPEEMMRECEELCAGQVTPEFLRAQIEVGTKVCKNVGEARADLGRLRGVIAEVAARHGLAPIAASTHPFATWQAQKRTPKDRYAALESDMQASARRLLICGMHIHIGIDDDNLRIDLMNQYCYFLPHLLALSTSSPFWMGRDTGLKSYRTTVFRRFPRTGVPDHFDSWSSYENYVQLLVDLHCIEDAKKIWWDVRPHPTFGTLEFRVCDVPTKPEATVMIAALCQAIIVKLHMLYTRNQGFRLYRRALIEENKWRAARWGLDGKLIDFGKRAEVPMRALAVELLEFIDDVVDELGSREAVNYVHRVLAEGTSADRQLAVYRRTGDLKAVVQHLVQETREGVEAPGAGR